MSLIGEAESAFVSVIPGGPWVRLALKAAPYIVIAILSVWLIITRADLDHVRMQAKVDRANIERDAATEKAAGEHQINTAVQAYADRTAALQPLVVRSTDTVTRYAETPAGRAPCAAPDRVSGIDALDASLFAPAAPSQSAGTVQAQPSPPAN